MQGPAVHQRAAAPAAHIIPQPQSFQGITVEQGIVPHLFEMPGHGQVPEAVIVPAGVLTQRAAGYQNLFPLDLGGGGREGMVPSTVTGKPNKRSGSTAFS